MTTLYLIRHGHYDHIGHADEERSTYSLSELGRGQIEALSERLKSHTIKKVYTSEITRAKESGQIIAERLHLPIESTPILNELGFFVSPQEIITFERDEAQYQQVVEDLSAATHRAVEFLQKVGRENMGETVAVVCHGNIIRSIVGQALKAEIDSIIRLQIDPASLSVLEYDGADLFRLIRLNDTCHLEK